uniref:NADH-ubiquinone oxidoreductase chain 3 n=2 Tax=Cicadellidae TaxID=30102 RepID=A0A7T1C512_9HEMI|nr:NADH dehydrogenase subunit 3 [Mitjaevia protuberanta]YP_010117068.1 NADH dehydrogenase subunit 3 [Gunungidia aurantiifasciata]QJA16313.1 NADH dehydrogenase subunit 3 [Mitjaevia protuberanta]QPM99281.1 NADH dehydrogenase subunit 3 [Gunungidia aurantiifasciata]
MYLVFIHLFIIMLISMVIIVMILLISKKSIFDIQKSSPFECGFNPMTYKRLPFSIHFFLIAGIFLIFDIEIIIIMPMILAMKSSFLVSWLMTSCLFITILLIGLYHEWLNGMLNWTN